MEFMGAGRLGPLFWSALVGLALMAHTRPLYKRIAQLETRLGDERLLSARLADTVISDEDKT
jgi:hypothetical protein